MITVWKSEIEKKYILPDESSGQGLQQRALAADLAQKWWVLQRDWVPDFAGFAMRHNGVLLRIRTNSYLESSGPAWMITLKQTAVREGIHRNLELEASESNPQNLKEIKSYIKATFSKDINLTRLISEGEKYAPSVGLTEHRILLEKRRREFANKLNIISLTVDELPLPTGWYAELEVADDTYFATWEQTLGLSGLTVETRDYGEIVKDATKQLAPSLQRRLIFV